MTEHTEKSVRDWLLHRIFAGSLIRAHNLVGVGSYPHEMDVFRILRSGYAEEYEIKLTASDIKNEAKKVAKYNDLIFGNQRAINSFFLEKDTEKVIQDAYAKGLPDDAVSEPYVIKTSNLRSEYSGLYVRVKSPIRRFTVVVPTQELVYVAVVSLPEWVGVLAIHGGDIRKAKDLPNSRKLTQEEIHHVAYRLAIRYYDMYFERRRGHGRGSPTQ